ncbi:nuclear transport factor 2 family protein [Altererythrobacter salegens]|uniref:Nuclear transport factor 2 family protein n=1 Tax=Croceibacterium salegens TaxID=1737568 RepID=A0A6I4SS69_9SPHN|nr:nuclear transport factor 2 family protein [Croceibacterium salegens]MXO58723.1 nuclear transport factor 2 family protein [Croceibacterium salegens]
MNLEATVADLAQRLEAVERRARAAEDHLAIANLQRMYGYYVDKSQWEHVADLFARDAVLEINGRGRFIGHERIREYMRHFGPPKDGLLMNHMQLQPVIHVDADGMHGYGRLRALMMVGQMGDHAMWGEAIYENAYVKEDGLWKISKLKAYQVFYTPYDKGWAKEVSPLLSEFGDFPPDEPIDPYPVYPEYFCPPYHYRNPVSGRE